MKLLVERDRFVRELEFVAQVLTQPPPNPALNAVAVAMWDNHLQLIASDGTTTARSELPTSSVPCRRQTFLVPPRLHRALKLISEPWLVFDVGGDTVTIRAGAHTYRHSQHPGRMDAILSMSNMPPTDSAASLDFRKFLNLLEKTRPFVSRHDITKFNSAGVWVEFSDSAMTARVTDGTLGVQISASDPVNEKRDGCVYVARALLHPILQMSGSVNARLTVRKTQMETAFKCEKQVLKHPFCTKKKPFFDKMFIGKGIGRVLDAAELFSAAKRLQIAIGKNKQRDVDVISAENLVGLQYRNDDHLLLFQENLGAGGNGSTFRRSICIDPLIRAAGLFRGEVALCLAEEQRALLLVQGDTRCAIACSAIYPCRRTRRTRKRQTSR